MTTATIDRTASRTLAVEVLRSLGVAHLALSDLVAELDLDNTSVWAEAAPVLASVAAEANAAWARLTGQPPAPAAEGVPAIGLVADLGPSIGVGQAWHVSRCSVVSTALGEPTAATAPVARRWLALEQAGPWGRDALRQSRLDSRIAAEVDQRAAAAGLSIIMIRRPGPHPDLHRPVPRQLYLADTTPGSVRLSHAVIDDQADLLDIDLTGTLGGDVVGPLVLVCTNARRDRCCAIGGRPLAHALAELHSPVWESSHLGGHRFAPTMLLLPYGLAYGRQSVDSAVQAIAAASSGLMVLDRFRGRTTWPRPGQAAEIAVREAIGEPAHDAFQVDIASNGNDGPWLAYVQHRDGRVWVAEVVREEGGEPRPESCGREPVPMNVYRTVALREAPAAHVLPMDSQ